MVGNLPSPVVRIKHRAIIILPFVSTPLATLLLLLLLLPGVCCCPNRSASHLRFTAPYIRTLKIKTLSAVVVAAGDLQKVSSFTTVF